MSQASVEIVRALVARWASGDYPNKALEAAGLRE
jgi:hypothetical protein